jgi:hypothetical protein
MLTYPSTATRPEPSNSAPATSIEPLERIGGSGTNSRTVTAQITARTAESTNTLRYPNASIAGLSTSIMGIVMIDAPVVTTPTAVIPTRGVQTWRAIATVSSTAPMTAPCRNRPSTKTTTFGAIRQTSDPANVTSMLTTRIRRLPWMSAVRPSNGAHIAPVSIALAFSHAA